MHPQQLHDVVGSSVRPLRRAEYDRLVDLGAFEDERVELLYGHLVTMRPQGTAHAHAVRKLNQMLTLALAGRALVQVQPTRSSCTGRRSETPIPTSLPWIAAAS